MLIQYAERFLNRITIASIRPLGCFAVNHPCRNGKSNVYVIPAFWRNFFHTCDPCSFECISLFILATDQMFTVWLRNSQLFHKSHEKFFVFSHRHPKNCFYFFEKRKLKKANSKKLQNTFFDRYEKSREAATYML